jgi:predicted phosphodiesterase
MSATERTCTRCRLPGGTGGFQKNAASPDGLRSVCRGCERRPSRKRGAASKFPRGRMDARVYVVVSDVHVPSQDRAAVAAACDYFGDVRPHGIVYNGDILDFDEVSRYSRDSVAKLEGKRIATSWLAGNEFLDQTTAACGPRLREKHWVEGNHERRLAAWLESGSNAVFKDDFALSVPDRLLFEKRGIMDHGAYPDASLRLGHLLVTHGTIAAKYTAARTLDKYGHSALVGHAHRPDMHYGSALEGNRAAYVAGHLADPDSPAMSYAPRPNAWAQGFATVYLRKSGAFQVTLHQLFGGVFYVLGRRYGGGA